VTNDGYAGQEFMKAKSTLQGRTTSEQPEPEPEKDERDQGEASRP
jgi:hypothetical protein